MDNLLTVMWSICQGSLCVNNSDLNLEKICSNTQELGGVQSLPLKILLAHSKTDEFLPGSNTTFAEGEYKAGNLLTLLWEGGG